MCEVAEARVAELEKERDHWKANHKNVIEQLRLFKQRPDLPVDRLPAYQRLVELQEQVERLKREWDTLETRAIAAEENEAVTKEFLETCTNQRDAAESALAELLEKVNDLLRAETDLEEACLESTGRQATYDREAAITALRALVKKG